MRAGHVCRSWEIKCVVFQNLTRTTTVNYRLCCAIAVCIELLQLIIFQRPRRNVISAVDWHMVCAAHLETVTQPARQGMAIFRCHGIALTAGVPLLFYAHRLEQPSRRHLQSLRRSANWTGGVLLSPQQRPITSRWLMVLSTWKTVSGG